MELRLRCFQLKWYVKMKYHTLQPVAGKFEIPTVLYSYRLWQFHFKDIARASTVLKNDGWSMQMT